MDKRIVVYKALEGNEQKTGEAAYVMGLGL